MTSHPAVVVSGIGKRNALLRLLHQECHAAGVRLVGCDAIPSPPARLEVEAFFLLPLARAPEFAAAHAEVLTSNSAAAYLTLIDPEIVPLGRLAEAYEAQGVRYVHPRPSTATVCEDKYLFFETMTAAGIATIATFLTPLDDFPFIRKDRFGSAASGLSATVRGSSCMSPAAWGFAT
jgi:biotin carboxylase